jgi:hypothetical protein
MSSLTKWTWISGFCALVGAEPVASADDAVPTVPHPHAYGLFVGSNTGGAGQEPLRYAEDDASRVAQVLRDLGRHGSSDLRVLAHPTAREVLAAVDEIGAKLRADREKGEEAVFYFFYSGHARANALNLGSDELGIAQLREKLMALPSTLTVVMLDACQSGSFARVKGAEPAADFSFNSVARLTQKGVAVMASSSSQELSQESDELKASYFTHHLVVALRGAGDADGDGRVSLDEAYRYAYRRTLASTSRTQVGGQHVTLDTDLSGRGEVPLTYPSDAKAALELPASLDAKVLVSHKPSGAIMAEVQKASGSKVRLALAAGTYEAIVRRPAQLAQCSVTLQDGQPTALDLATCTPIKDAPSKKKGDADDDDERELRNWHLELGFGFNFRSGSAWQDRLREFGYEHPSGGFLSINLPPARLQVSVARQFGKNVMILIQGNTLTRYDYERKYGASNDQISYTSYGGAAYLRAFADVLPPLRLYAQAGGGFGLGFTTFASTPQVGPRVESTDTYFGPLLGAAGGLYVRAPRYVTGFLQGGYEYAPVIDNMVGDTHNVGGAHVMTGIGLHFE